MLLGSLLVPLGIPLRHARPDGERRASAAREGETGGNADRGAVTSTSDGRRRPLGPRIGDLPLARRDVEGLRQILGLERRLRDIDLSPRAQRALTARSIFPEALTWLEIHGRRGEVVEYWKTVVADRHTEVARLPEAPTEGEPPAVRRRRRRRWYRPVP